MFGYEAAELIGREAEALFPGSEALFDSAQSHLVGTGRAMNGLRRDGSRFPVEVGASPVDQNGKPAVVATLIDISERCEAEERQQMLTRELLHRSQNLFAVIQAIATRSLAEGKKLADARTDFFGRLHALARSNALMVEEGGETAPLEKIIRRELDGFSEHIRINGCSIRLNRASTQNFALIVHELATNAVKYGALSQPTGVVSIEGQLDDSLSLFTFHWRELGGPAVVPPQRRGFGTTVLTEVGRQVGEHAWVHWEAEGLVYELRARVPDIGEVQP